MPRDKTQSHQLIVKSAKEEFLEQGYEKASMRTIADKAGLTVGALYKHFATKEAMFAALVDPVYEKLVSLYQEQTQQSEKILLDDGLEKFEENSVHSSQVLLTFVFNYFDEFQLLFHASAGTRYEDIRERMVRLEAESSIKHEEIVKRHRGQTQAISDEIMHIFFTMSMTPLFEIIEHGYPYDKAAEIMTVLSQAQNHAWSYMVKLNGDI